MIKLLAALAAVITAISLPAGGNWMTDMQTQLDPSGSAVWVFEDHGGYGASDGHTIYINPDTPVGKRFSVMAHEYGHILEARAYGSLWAAPQPEKLADCIALQLGATWLNYGCPDSLAAVAASILDEKEN